MTALIKTFRRIGSGALLAGLLAAAAHGQDEAETSSADAFNIPENISILGPSDPNLRKATAKVNGSIITGTDVDQRVALIIAANQAAPPPDELQRLRLRVFRNLIDETLQIQEAAALDMAVTPQEVDETYARLAGGRGRREIDFADAVLGGAARSLHALVELVHFARGHLNERHHVAPQQVVPGQLAFDLALERSGRRADRGEVLVERRA